MLADESGSALVEFVFIALVVFVPLVYIVAGFSAVRRGVFASTAAAREAGRAIGTAPDAATGLARATRAAQLAVEDQSGAASDVCGWPTRPPGWTARTRVASRRRWRRGRSSPSA
jgi:hypothetical protein